MPIDAIFHKNAGAEEHPGCWEGPSTKALQPLHHIGKKLCHPYLMQKKEKDEKRIRAKLSVNKANFELPDA